MCAKTLKLKKLTIVAKLHVVNSYTTTHITFGEGEGTHTHRWRQLSIPLFFFSFYEAIVSFVA